jgi:membrane protein DedA with SNARE-associated domain
VAVEYAILLVLAAVAGVGVPGPGDSALIAAALLAAEGSLTLALVLVLAFLGSLAGRMIGYELGAKGGRPLMERPGWFEGFRSRAVAKGDHLFERFPRAAILIAPAPLSGIHDVMLRSFVVASVVVSTTWTLSTGLVAYFLGDEAKDALSDIGIKGVIVIVALAATGLLYRYLWRRWRPHGLLPRIQGDVPPRQRPD